MMEENNNNKKNNPTKMACTVLAFDHTNFCYRVCSTCEKTLPHNTHHPTSSSSSLCNFNNSSAASKRLFRILMSIATDTKVFTVICFDRAARVLFGCSADEFFDFAKLHPFAVATASKILEGEMFEMQLSKPKNGNAQHVRVVSVVPLRTGFQPVIISLREVYRVEHKS